MAWDINQTRQSPYLFISPSLTPQPADFAGGLWGPSAFTGPWRIQSFLDKPWHLYKIPVCCHSARLSLVFVSAVSKSRGVYVKQSDSLAFASSLGFYNGWKWIKLAQKAGKAIFRSHFPYYYIQIFTSVIKLQLIQFLKMPFFCSRLFDEPDKPILSPLGVEESSCRPDFLTYNGRLGPNWIVILEAHVSSNAEPKWQVPVIVSLLC